MASITHGVFGIFSDFVFLSKSQLSKVCLGWPKLPNLKATAAYLAKAVGVRTLNNITHSIAANLCYYLVSNVPFSGYRLAKMGLKYCNSSKGISKEREKERKQKPSEVRRFYPKIHISPT